MDIKDNASIKELVALKKKIEKQISKEFLSMEIVNAKT